MMSCPRPTFGIDNARLRLWVWIVCCGASAGCVATFWPLGVLPFVMLVLFSVAATKSKGRPWG